MMPPVAKILAHDCSEEVNNDPHRGCDILAGWRKAKLWKAPG
jgi:hypothetical protein